jgi:hypothetical protein
MQRAQALAPGAFTRLMGSRSAPIFGSMADDAMEREGKAAGVRVAADHVVVCVLCGVCEFFVCLCFVDCRVGAPTTAKLSLPQHSADDGPPREMSTTQSSSLGEDY